MDEEEFFDAQFPGASPLLRCLRTQDKEFDRICLDYQEMFAELARPPDPEVVLEPRYLADLAETISDLRSCIETKLSNDPDASAILNKTEGLK
ncbi:MAG: hypothetical protein AB3N12_06195 [Ruegeria sp.]